MTEVRSGWGRSAACGVVIGFVVACSSSTDGAATGDSDAGTENDADPGGGGADLDDGAVASTTGADARTPLVDSGGGGSDDAGGGGVSTPDAATADAGIDGDCATASDCPAIDTFPADCSEAVCESGGCTYRGRDGDADGFIVSRCQTQTPGIVVEVGSDCDDADANVNPAAWDGPAGDGFSDGCNDTIDQDCNGVVDDGQLLDGSTCVCSPGEAEPCATTPNGNPLDFPVADTSGAPVGQCKLGSRECLPGGTWGSCTGAIGPDVETCDQEDDDCDGETDEPGAFGELVWNYDADGDGFDRVEYPRVVACSAPTAAPQECLDLASVPGDCPDDRWVLGPLPASQKDCDDFRADISPAEPGDLCDGTDYDCDGSDLSGCDCTAGQVNPQCGDFTGPADPSNWTSATNCAYGSQTCGASGDWSACDAVRPQEEQCGTVDFDCDGLPGNQDIADAVDAVLYVCDHDSDQHLVSAAQSIAWGCPGVAPSASCSGTWRLRDAFSHDDCNDFRDDIHGGMAEWCDGVDNDCSQNGIALPEEDADGDGHASESYSGCQGAEAGPPPEVSAFPKDDCYDDPNNSEGPFVFGGQTTYSGVGYCPTNGLTPVRGWCVFDASVASRCGIAISCDPASYDYNCDGIETKELPMSSCRPIGSFGCVSIGGSVTYTTEDCGDTVDIVTCGGGSGCAITPTGDSHALECL